MLAHRRGASRLNDPGQRPLRTEWLPGGQARGGPGHAELRSGWLIDRLRSGGARLRALEPERRLRAWRQALARLVDPSSTVRRDLDPALCGSVRLSPQGLQAGLEAIASGLLGPSADELFHSARDLAGDVSHDPALVVLASNLPGLALQSVLPALARGRSLIVKSSQQEPHFAPALLSELEREEPGLGEAFAALSWPRGAPIERSLLACCDPVLAYGGHDALDALRARTAGRFVAYGPKLSIGVVAPDANDAQIRHLARDVALFDQRGCLSVQVVLSFAGVDRVAGLLARGLDAQADLLPPGRAALEEAAAARREVDLERMRGRETRATRGGWVVTEPAGEAIRPSPGMRLVRVHAVSSSEELEALLTPLSGSLQGAALAGKAPAQVGALLDRLGISRVAPAGRLQETDARWQNGGVDPVEVL